MKDFYTYPELKGLGITFSREWIRTLEKKGQFPLHTDLSGDGRRIAWEKAAIEKLLAEQERLARANAKLARAETKRRAKAAISRQDRK